MNTRKLALGDRNIVGQRVAQARQALGLKQTELLARLQIKEIDISASSLSLLEGQKLSLIHIFWIPETSKLREKEP